MPLGVTCLAAWEGRSVAPGEREKAVHGAEAVETQTKTMAARAHHAGISQQVPGTLCSWLWGVTGCTGNSDNRSMMAARTLAVRGLACRTAVGLRARTCLPLRVLSSSASQGALRAFNELDSSAIRKVDPRLSGKAKSVLSSENPGIRVELNVVTKEEESYLVEEVLALKAVMGFQIGALQTVLVRDHDGEQKRAQEVAVVRVTGRPEIEAEHIAPWGYGDNFDYSRVPPALLQLVRKVEALHGYEELGKCRDITLDFRDQSFFKLDPGIDPADDGSHIVSLALLSDAVVTFIPPIGPNATARYPAEVAMQSWTVDDFDVLSKRRGVVCYSGDARWLWRHAVRIGVEVPEPEQCVCDWWGSRNILLRRGEQRITVDLAFQGSP
ncbi:hypothetical protein T484DRAFT_3108834 [Baffinella frigidus]|nr:hypothetical protein T484DRAFT_3108834 [Cryptophyta sp. CCMP2293]